MLSAGKLRRPVSGADYHHSDGVGPTTTAAATATITVPEPIRPAAWGMLALGFAAQAAGTVLITAPAYLIPLLHLHRGVPLASAGLLAATPTLGMVLTLVIWGALADTYGERWVIAGGLASAAAFGLAAAAVATTSYLAMGALLFLAGACAASTNAASGRVVVGWFPRSRRGLAMGIRQTAQPIGVAVAALSVPALAQSVGLSAPLVMGGVLTACVSVACGLWIVNPPRHQERMPALAQHDSDIDNRGDSETAREDHGEFNNPYRGDRDHYLLRIHLLSLLLVLPQFTLSVFGLVWLISVLRWSATAAGAVVAGAQLVGAIGRIAVGQLSDRVGSRVKVLRWIAISGVVLMAATAAAGALHLAALGAGVLILASTVSVADNGLSFTLVAEAAGRAWSGKALGVQNTGQFIAASSVGPGVGALIGALGYAPAFALVALAPLAALPLVPTRDRHRD